MFVIVCFSSFKMYLFDFTSMTKHLRNWMSITYQNLSQIYTHSIHKDLEIETKEHSLILPKNIRKFMRHLIVVCHAAQAARDQNHLSLEAASNIRTSPMTPLLCFRKYSSLVAWLTHDPESAPVLWTVCTARWERARFFYSMVLYVQ